MGGGISADAFHPTSIHPEGEGASISMEAALDDSDLRPDQIDHINLHATSTRLGDLAEIKAVEKVFGNHLPNIAVSATKSMTGHLLGAAGALEAVFCVKTLISNQIPPNTNLFEFDPGLPEGLTIPLKPIHLPSLKYALSNSFGFGGHNASVIFGKYPYGQG